MNSLIKSMRHKQPQGVVEKVSGEEFIGEMIFHLRPRRQPESSDITGSITCSRELYINFSGITAAIFYLSTRSVLSVIFRFWPDPGR
jgi:hypothetical protein